MSAADDDARDGNANPDAPRDGDGARNAAAPLAPPEGVGALVLFTARLDACVAFYRALGLPLAGERHGSGPMHHTCDLGGTHFALFEAEIQADADGAGDALTHRSAGAQFFGLSVRNLDAVAAHLEALDLGVRQPPTSYPWGRRMLVDDPDGRVVELFERPG